MVEDQRGRFAEGLFKKDFRILVDGSPIALEDFEFQRNIPVSFAVLIDTSGSMASFSKLDWARNAVRLMLKQARPGDEFALFAFSQGEVRRVSDFGTSPVELLRKLDRLRPDGETALYDAVAATTSRLVSGRNLKRAILLFTDGVDTASEISTEQVRGILEEVSIPVYPVGLVTWAPIVAGGSPSFDVDSLRLLADASGGRVFLAESSNDMRGVVSKISREVRRQYLLGFAASGSGGVKFRRVEVSVPGPRKWRTRTRRGYVGTRPRAKAPPAASR